MTTGWKIGLALAGAYLAVPVVKRMSVGCPAFSGQTKTIPVSGGGTVTALVCPPITLGELLLWPLAPFVFHK